MLFGSLRGMRIVDFSQIGAGPLCGMYLGDLGADVVKVESPDGDLGRKIGPPWDGDDAAIHTAFNRNKRSLCVDLKNPEGLRVVRALLDKADVVVESFRPGVMDKLGLGYGSLRETNPSLVYCSVSAYGQTGPFSKRAGVDGILQAASGLMSLIGEPGGEPCKVQSPVVDIATGCIATIAVLAALYDRQATGRGTHLDASLFAAALVLQQSSLTGYLADGDLPTKQGSAAPYSSPNEAFPTADGHVMVAAYMPGRWVALCSLLGVPELAVDPRFATSPDRVANRAALREQLGRLFREDTTQSWIEKLDGADILCSPVATYDTLAEHPQIVHADLLPRSGPAGDGRTCRFPAFPVRDCHSVASYAIAPALGEHGRPVLSELGLTPVEIDALEACGAVKPCAEVA